MFCLCVWVTFAGVFSGFGNPLFFFASGLQIHLNVYTCRMLTLEREHYLLWLIGQSINRIQTDDMAIFGKEKMKLMMNRIFLLFGWIVCLFCSVELKAEDKTPLLLDACRPLLAPDCVVDDIVEEVKVLGNIKHTDYNIVLDQNLDNSVPMPTALISAGVGFTPIISIRDLKNTYKGGQSAGFVIDRNFRLLGVDLLKGLIVSLYLDNKLVYTEMVEEKNLGLLSLSLFSNQSASTLSIDVPPVNDNGEPIVFDEVMLGTTGINLNLFEKSNIYYGFVGIQEKKMVGSEYKSDHMEIVNNPETGYTDSDVLDLGINAYVQLKDNKMEEPNQEVGFVFMSTGLLGANVAKTITFYDEKGKELESFVPEAGLDIQIIADKQHRISAVPTQPWNKVKLTIGGAGLLTSQTIYYAYTKPLDLSTAANKKLPDLSADALLYTDAARYTLSCGKEVTWSLTQILSLETKTDITDNKKGGVSIDPATGLSKTATITFSKEADGGIYIFKAVDAEGVEGTVTLTKGKTPDMITATNELAAVKVLNRYTDSVHLAEPRGGALIPIDQLAFPENILDGNLTTYARYAKGLQLAAHTGIVGVQKNVGMFSDSIKAVGFVVETPPTLLGADVLKFYNISLYNNGKEIYNSAIQQNSSVQASLLGAPGSGMVRYAIRVPKEYQGKFDSFTLFTSGVLNLDLTNKSIKIYGAFTANDDKYILFDNPVSHKGVLPLTLDNTGAQINYAETGNTSLVQVVTVMANLGYLLEGNTISPDKRDSSHTAISYTTAGAVGSTDIAIKAGRDFARKSWMGFLFRKPTGLAEVDLISKMRIQAFHQGEKVAESGSGTILGADVIGWGDIVSVSCYVNKPIDEIRLQNGMVLGAVKPLQYLGSYTFADEDGDGIPDEEDPDFDRNPIELEIKPTKVEDMNRLCASTPQEIVAVSVKAKPKDKLFYTLSNIDTQKPVMSDTITCDEHGRANFKINLDTLNLKEGRYELVVYVHNQPLIKPAKYIFVIHPTQTRWVPKNKSTDWNDWNNWSHGVPVIGCSDVVIPSNSPVFPVLKEYELTGTAPADFNSCQGIHFEFGSEMLGTQHLNYSKAWTDLELSFGRYYLLSSPLQETYTGDFFIPKEKYGNQNNPYFTKLDETTAPESRKEPTAYHRLWATSAPVVLPNNDITGETDAQNGSGHVVRIETTKWTPPFNAMKYQYQMGEGFSFKAEKKEISATKARFRFPKEHTRYYYYNKDNLQTDMYETLGRQHTGRLFTDGLKNWPLKLHYTAPENETSTVFLVGNPFMAHINIQEFLKENATITSVKVYDGNAANSMIESDGKLLTNGTDEWTSIAPMQSFFVTVKDAAKTVDISFTEAMLETQTQGKQPLRIRPNRKEEVPTVVVQAQTDSICSHAKVVFQAEASEAYEAQEDAALLLDDDVKPKVVVYTLAGNQATDIQQCPDADVILLGMTLQEPAPLTVSLQQTAGKTWSLYDAWTNTVYACDSVNTVHFNSMDTNVGRFALVRSDRMDVLQAAKQEVLLQRTATNRVSVQAPLSTTLLRCEVFTMEGARVSQWVGNAPRLDNLKIARGCNLIRVCLSDGTVKSFKMISY